MVVLQQSLILCPPVYGLNQTYVQMLSLGTHNCQGSNSLSRQ